MKLTTIMGATIAAFGLAACSSSVTPTERPATPTVVPSSTATPTPTPTATPTASATPTPSAMPVPGDALAVVGSENVGIGPYTLGLVNTQGVVVAAVTANTPSVLNGGVAITSTSDNRLYYENGNTDIDYLTATGQHGLAFTVKRPSDAVVAFAVSPDDTRVAVAVLSNFFGISPPYTSHMYLMAKGGGTQQTLFDGSGTSSTAPLTWPVGWDGDKLIVAQTLPTDFTGLGIGTNPCSLGVDCSSQLRTFDPADRKFGTPLCIGDDAMQTIGIPNAAGIGCVPSYGGATPQELRSFSWSGAITNFGTDLNGSCMLSPLGDVMACPSDLYEDATGEHNALGQAFRAGGVAMTVSDPADFQFIGWLDEQNVVISTGGSIAQGGEFGGLAVENILTGVRIPVTLAVSPNPYSVRWQVMGTIPGGL